MSLKHKTVTAREKKNISKDLEPGCIHMQTLRISSQPQTSCRSVVKFEGIFPFWVL